MVLDQCIACFANADFNLCLNLESLVPGPSFPPPSLIENSPVELVDTVGSETEPGKTLGMILGLVLGFDITEFEAEEGRLGLVVDTGECMLVE